MISWDQPDDPHVDEELVDRAIATAQRRRARRTVLVGACGLAAATAVAIPLLSGLSGGAGPTVADRTGPPGGSSAEPNHTIAIPVSDRARIYAAALAGGPHPQQLDAPVYVRDGICATVVTDPGAPCTYVAIPPTVQREVSTLVGPDVRFAADPTVPAGAGDRAVIQFGELNLTGDRATLGIAVLCGPLCGQGQTLVLTDRDGRSRVTGTTGPEWIS